MTDVILYTHINTPAAQINPPLYAKRGSEWFLVNSFEVRRIPAPLESSVTAINERLMRTAKLIKARVAAIQ